MKDYLNARIHIALILILIAGSIFAGAWVSHINQRDIESALSDRLMKQREHLYSLAEITDGNGADEVIGSIITDCPRRTEYESMLIALGTLSKKDLVTLQTLFESCGAFYAERKALMVAKFEYELEQYKDLGSLRAMLTDDAVDSYEFDKWSELVILEKSRSQLLTEQNAIQERIISALLKGSTATSKDVSTLVGEAQGIADLLMVNGQKIDVIRGDIKH